MSSIKNIRSRVVYDIITLVSEVSGFADIFMVCFGFLVGAFIRPRLIESTLLSYLGPILKLKAKKENHSSVFDKAKSTTLDKDLIAEFLKRLSNIKSINLSLWYSIFMKQIPRFFYTRRTDKILFLAD